MKKLLTLGTATMLSLGLMTSSVSAHSLKKVTPKKIVHKVSASELIKSYGSSAVGVLDGWSDPTEFEVKTSNGYMVFYTEIIGI